MKKTRADMMLKISSILMIIFGIINFIVSLLGVRMGSAIISAATGEGAVFTTIFGILIIVFSMIMCVSMLLSGILGLIGKKLVFCQRLSFSVLMLAFVTLSSIIESGGFQWYGLLSLVLPIFYCYAVWAVRKERGIPLKKEKQK